MKKLLIPLLILLSLSACDFGFGPHGTPPRDPYQYVFNGYVVIGNPAENYGDTILVYPNFDLEFVEPPIKTPKDSLFDIFVKFEPNIKIHNIDTTRKVLDNSVYILGDTLKCSVIHSKSGQIQFIIDDPDDNVFRQGFSYLTLSIKD